MIDWGPGGHVLAYVVFWRSGHRLAPPPLRPVGIELFKADDAGKFALHMIHIYISIGIAGLLGREKQLLTARSLFKSKF